LIPRRSPSLNSRVHKMIKLNKKALPHCVVGRLVLTAFTSGPPCRCCALVLAVGLNGCLCCRLALRIVDWAATSLNGLWCRRSAYRIADWPSTSSIGPSCCRMAHRIVDWPAAASISLLGCRLACRTVNWPAGLSIGVPYGRFACWVVEWPAMSFGLGCCCCAHCAVVWPFAGVRVAVSVRGGGQLWLGRSPLCVLLPLRVSSIEPDDDGPTSLRRGEGHRVWLSSVVGEVVIVVMGWREDEPTSTIDAVDVGFKLRSHLSKRARSYRMWARLQN